LNRLFFILLIYSSTALTQTPKADSLRTRFETETVDSIRQVNRLLYIQELRHNYAATCKHIFDGIEDAKKNHDFYFLGHYYGGAGIMYSQIGNNDSALICFQNSLNYRIFIKDTSGIAAANLGMSNTYRNIGDYKNAIRYGLESEKMYLLTAETPGLARIYNALGLIFKQQKEYEQALAYYHKCLDAALEIQDETMLAGIYSNIGGVFQEQLNYDSALVYHRRALELRKKNNDPMGLGISYGNFGLIYLEENNFDSAFYYTNLALEKFTAINYTGGMQMCYRSIGKIWKRQGNHQKAISAFKKAEDFARAGNFLPDLVDICQQLSESYEAVGNYKESNRYLKQYVSLRDSVFNNEKSKEVQKIQLESEYQQKQLADSLKLAEKEKIATLETEKQKQLNEVQAARFRTYMLGGALVFVLIFVVLLLQYRSNQKHKEYNRIIAEQKATVVEKNKEITDSITYAKRIQEAILPPAHLVAKKLPQSFILYKPKDIVAGDFYWFEYATDQILIAAADCTGHGVPGAMVSVVCSNALNRSVKEFGIKTPSKILDKVRDLVIETFEKSEKDVKDGMDIALVSIKQKPNSVSKLIEYSGANNPLWVIKKDSSVCEEIKADKQPIGNYADHRPFTNHTVELNTGDTIYFFTDGYQDQFGGEKGKKFKPANLVKLICQIQSKSMSDQKIILDQTFENWRGKLEQVDDVCIIGIRL
jgi:serine phosphatase RsbU (regulator of sigma subunit)